jgi:hypothetical protein
MDDVDPIVPDHLRTVLGAAAEQEFEAVSGGHWPDDDDARAAHRDAIRAASHMVDNWEAGCPTREEVVRLARRAIGEQQPREFIGQWPTTLDEVDGLIARAILTRDLIQYRDALGGDADVTEGDA